ncbi:MAG: hypothetical protein NUW37_00980 [Planctomycetes bacterium]|nr:hypothetical protein [Planctomycetota bacterium]
MSNKDIISQTAERVTPISIRDYAVSRGWLIQDGFRQRVWLLNQPGDGFRQLIVPIDQDEDWDSAFRDVVRRLAEYEQKSETAILDGLLNTDADVVRFRVSGRAFSGGIIPLNKATNLLDGARKAILSSACSVLNKVRHHPRLSRAEPDSLINKCKIGQTEAASFGIKIICPLDDIGEPRILNQCDPFARATTLLLINACNKIVDGIENDNVDRMLEEDGRLQPIVTSNLCEALLRMNAENEDAELAVEVSWASNPRLPAPPSTKNRVTFKPEYFSALEEIFRKLQPANELDEERFYLGTVETLSGDVEKDGRRAGEVIFELLIPDEGSVRAKGNLDAPGYEKALHAHKEGFGYVSFRAILHRGARIGRLERISNFNEITASAPSKK